MKKICSVLIFSLLVLFSTQTFAQKFGIQGGINLSNLVDKDDNIDYADELGYKANAGFNGGITLEVGFGNLIAVEIGALVESKGAKITSGNDFIKLNLIYADVPVLIKAGPSFGPLKIFGAAGPYVGFGLTGKSVIKLDGSKDSQDTNWGSGPENDFKRLDYGAKFGVGAEVMGFTIGAYYSLGLANIAAETTDGYKEMNRVISISAGYKFGK